MYPGITIIMVYNRRVFQKNGYFFSFLGPDGAKNDDSAFSSARKIRERPQKRC